MNPSPVSIRPGVWVAPTPVHVPASGQEPRRRTHPLEAWTVVTAVELGIRGLGHASPPTDQLRPVLDESGGARSRLGTKRVICRPPAPRPRQSRAKVIAAPQPSAPADRPDRLVANYLQPFSDRGLVLRWTRFDSYLACTLLTQRTFFDAARAFARADSMPERVEQTLSRVLGAGPNPFLRITQAPVSTLLPGAMGWVGELAIRAPQRPGYGCSACDERVGHCPQDPGALIEVLEDLDGPWNLDFLISPSFRLGPSARQNPNFGFQLQARIMAPRRPRPDLLTELCRRLVAPAFLGSPVLRQHDLATEHRVRTEAAAAGTPLGPPLAGLGSVPLTAPRVVQCLPWPRRSQ